MHIHFLLKRFLFNTSDKSDFEEIQQAQVEPVLRALAQINIASQSGSLQASTWLVEKLRPKDFGRDAQLDIDSNEEFCDKCMLDGEKIEIDGLRINFKNGQIRRNS